MRTLKRDERGDDVRRWQEFLIGQGLLEAGGADGIFGEKTDEATREFQRRHPPLEVDGIVGPHAQAQARALGFQDEQDGGELEAGSERLLGTVHPVLAERIRQLAETTARQNPAIPIRVTSGMRTFAEQEALFQKGRDANGNVVDRSKVVTNARPGQSYHNYGLALDLVSLRDGRPDFRDASPSWPIMGREGQRLGLEWGGAWTSFVDRPHFQLTTGLRLRECMELRNAGGTDAVWAEVNRRLALEGLASEPGEEVE